MGQGRRQTERITSKPGGVREAGSKQSGEGVKQSRQYTGRQTRKTARKCYSGENKTSHWVSVCVLLLCEWVNEVQVWWGNQGWWVNGDSCVIGVMVDGNVCVQCMMGDVVHGWCAVEVSGNQIHDSSKDECKSFGFGTVMKELITDDRIQIFKRTVPLNNVFSYRKIVSTLFHLTIAIVINDSPVFVLFFPHVLFWILTVLNLDCFAVKFFFVSTIWCNTNIVQVPFKTKTKKYSTIQ